MTGGSTLDPENLPGTGTRTTDGRSTGVLGPSDTSDSGSDVSSGQAMDESILDSDTDASGTGEGSSSPGRADGSDLARDIGFDRIVGRDQAGLGRGLDQAEEALANSGGDGTDASRLEDDEDDASIEGTLDTILADDADPTDDDSSDDDSSDDDSSDDSKDVDDTDDAPDATRLADALHGRIGDDDDAEDDEDDEDEDGADENEGEPASPAIEAPGAEQYDRPSVRRSRA